MARSSKAEYFPVTHIDSIHVIDADALKVDLTYVENKYTPEQIEKMRLVYEREAARNEKKKEYDRQYYAANKEARKEYQRQYYTANKEVHKEYQRQHYAARREMVKAYKELMAQKEVTP